MFSNFLYNVLCQFGILLSIFRYVFSWLTWDHDMHLWEPWIHLGLPTKLLKISVKKREQIGILVDFKKFYNTPRFSCALCLYYSHNDCVIVSVLGSCYLDKKLRVLVLPYRPKKPYTVFRQENCLYRMVGAFLLLKVLMPHAKAKFIILKIKN